MPGFLGRGLDYPVLEALTKTSRFEKDGTDTHRCNSLTDTKLYIPLS